MFFRELSLGPAANPESRTVPVTVASETPVDRGGYLEVLDHGRGRVDLSRAPLPLIESHDKTRLPIGTVDNLHVEGQALKGVARFGRSPRAQEVFQDVMDGVVRGLSVGYEYTGQPTEMPDGETLRFPWRPLEVSAVAVPADPKAGFFRSFPHGVQKMDTNPNQDNVQQLSRSQRRALRVTDEERAQFEGMERERCAEISAASGVACCYNSPNFRRVRPSHAPERDVCGCAACR